VKAIHEFLQSKSLHHYLISTYATGYQTKRREMAFLLEKLTAAEMIRKLPVCYVSQAASSLHVCNRIKRCICTMTCSTFLDETRKTTSEDSYMTGTGILVYHDVHYYVHKSLPPAPIWRQLEYSSHPQTPAHISLRLNLILSSHLRQSPKRFHAIRFWT
jgi:hypothetical protein